MHKFSQVAHSAAYQATHSCAPVEATASQALPAQCGRELKCAHLACRELGLVCSLLRQPQEHHALHGHSRQLHRASWRAGRGGGRVGLQLCTIEGKGPAGQRGAGAAQHEAPKKPFPATGVLPGPLQPQVLMPNLNPGYFQGRSCRRC